MPKLDLSAAPIKTGSIYPPPYAAQMAGRSSLRLGELAGLYADAAAFTALLATGDRVVYGFNAKVMGKLEV